MSPRERQVLDCLQRGLSTKEIAIELDIAINTVKVYIYAVYGKLGLRGNRDARAFLAQTPWRVAS